MKCPHRIRSFTALLLVLGITTSAFFSWYNYIREKAEWEMQRQAIISSGVFDDLLIQVEMTVDAFEQAKEGEQEVILNGVYYDIAAKQKRGDQVYLKLLVDEEEEKLEARFRSLRQQTSSNQRKNKSTNINAGLIFAKALIPNNVIYIPCVLLGNYHFFSDLWCGDLFHPLIPSSPPDLA